MLNILACLFFALNCSLSVASCAQVQHQSQGEVEKGARFGNLPSKDSKSQDKRTAIRDIEGCSRDQTTFYKGKVLSFRRTTKSTEITVRTEWDTTEKLTQPNEGRPIDFRLDDRPIKDAEWKRITSALAAHTQPVGATVWICRKEDKEILKMIDWTLPGNNSTP